MTDAPQKPFWKRKRWIAAAVVWLLVAYPASLGPVAYVNARGWLPPSAVSHFVSIYSPLDHFIMNDLPGSGLLSGYALWFYRTAQRHAASL